MSVAKRAVRAGAWVLMAQALALSADPLAGLPGKAGSAGGLGSFFENWLDRVSKIQAQQPHWVTPLATVTPRLEQELRYDQFWQTLPGNHELDNYGGSKGVELIPFSPVEFIIGVPAWENQNTTPPKQGWADETFLIKYRIASANEQNGNYIVTAFLGLSVPNGSSSFSSQHYSVTPTIAFGKGWGAFDFQSTLAVSVPDNGGARSGAGTPVLFNTALQYRVARFLWPEVEANYTYWPNGKHEGLNQLLITPGLLLGRIPVYHRVGVTLGVGVQVAVTEGALLHRNIIFSARVPF